MGIKFNSQTKWLVFLVILSTAENFILYFKNNNFSRSTSNCHQTLQSRNFWLGIPSTEKEKLQLVPYSEKTDINFQISLPQSIDFSYLLRISRQKKNTLPHSRTILYCPKLPSHWNPWDDPGCTSFHDARTCLQDFFLSASSTYPPNSNRHSSRSSWDISNRGPSRWTCRPCWARWRQVARPDPPLEAILSSWAPRSISKQPPHLPYHL